MTQTWNASEVAVSDIEGNNLLYGITQMHCGVIINPFILEERIYGPEESTKYLENLKGQKVVVGHNFRGFDLLALEKLFGFQYPGFCFDTLVLSRLLNPERLAHSLEAWGEKLRFRKGDFGKMNDWSVFSQAMMDYCVQDCRVNAILFLYFIDRLGWYDWFGTNQKECRRIDKAIREGDLKRVH